MPPKLLTRNLPVIALTGVVVLWLAGAAHAIGLASLPLLDLDEEGTIPTAFSGLLLLSGAAAAVVAAALGAPARRSLHLVGGALAFLALDEVWRLHESLEARVGFDWQAIYLPIGLVALVGWAGVLRTLGERSRERLAWAAGAACWVVSQVLEVFQWEGQLRPGGGIDGGLSEREVEDKLSEPAYLAKMLPEELLEMTGSLLFALVLVHVARRAAGWPH